MRDSEAATFYASRTNEENELRYMLFMQHSHDGSSAYLYGDDGEMSCGVCNIDFVRDSVEIIKQKNYDFNMRECVRLGLIKLTPNAEVTGAPTTGATKGEEA